MSRKTRIIICCLLIIFAFGAGIFAYAQTREGKTKRVNAEGTKTYLVDKNGKIEFDPDPTNAAEREEAMKTRGNSEDNPLVVLEIVPYEGMAKFGYQIAGQEPLDVDAMAMNSVWVQDEDTLYNVSNKVYAFWTTDKPELLEGYAEKEMNQYGLMRYVPGGGQYSRTVDQVDGDGNVIKATYTAMAGGGFEWTPLSAEECLALSDEEKASYENVYQNAVVAGDAFKMYFEKVPYVEKYGKKLEHKNTFLRESVGLAYDMEDGVRIPADENDIKVRIANYHSKVITVTPEDLNLNPGLVDRADLIIISTPSSNDIKTYGANKNKYIRDGVFGYEEEDDPTYGRDNNTEGATFRTNLLNWDIALKIYDRATNPVRICPIIVDTELYSDTKGKDGDALSEKVTLTKRLSDGSLIDQNNMVGTQNNMAKLFLMMYQMTNPVFESYYGEVTATNHVMFDETNMKDYSAENTNANKDVVRKGVTLTTGVFKYDKNWPAEKTITDSNSRVYWSDLTMYPWQIFPKSASSGHSNPSEYGKYASMYGIMVESSPYDNNLTSGDAQNSLRNGLLMYDGDTKMTSGYANLFCGIKNNAFGAELYTFFDSINGSAGAPPDTDTEGCLTTADCLYYLLNGLQPMNVYNQKYKILELQPSPIYEDKDTFWKGIVAAYTNSTIAPEVDQMTTSEFIGSHVECISEYDLIYVGANKSSTDITMKFPSGTTDFIYAHTGPTVTVSSPFRALYGWLTKEGEWNIEENREKLFVFSGNDLTTLALNKLKEYSEAGLPIMFAEKCYKDGGGISERIDGNSNIYTLMKEATNGFSVYKLMREAVVRSDLMKIMTTNSTKVEMVMHQSPRLYNSELANDNQKYLDSDRTLRFRFTIDAPEGTYYNVKLSVDSNTDGVFSEGLEDIGASVYRIEGGLQYNHSGLLEAGKTYAVSRVVGDRIGSVVWKLDLIKDGKVYASLDGVSAIKEKDESEKEDVVILQIEPNTKKSSIKLPTTPEEASAFGGASEKFYNWSKDINGMNLIFERIKETDLKTALEADIDYLYKNYDMIVLGFSDVYDGVSEETVLDAIDEFIDSGKAVLYTHDTSSTIGNSDGDDLPKWGEMITLEFRDKFGMDRYGAMGYKEEEKAIEDLDVTPGKDTPWQPVAGSPDYTKIMKSTDSTQRPLVQGVANGILYRTLYPSTYGTGHKGEKYKGENRHDVNVNTKKVTRVNQGAITEYPYTIDEEIVVAKTHPQYYQLDMEKEDIVVWYCLAKEGDKTEKEKEEDPEIHGLTDDTGLDYQNAYFKETPNDVRNNYYIYNIGNVTYSGMGHLPWYADELDMQISDDEIKLFINTFVAAYRATAKGVKVEVVNDDVAVDATTGTQYVYVDVDSSDPKEIVGNAVNGIVDKARTQVEYGTGYKEAEDSAHISMKSKRIYFRLRDENSYGKEATSYSLKIVWNNGLEANDIIIDGESTMLAVYRKIDNSGGEKFVDTVSEKYQSEDNCVYFVDVPIIIDDSTGTEMVAETELSITVTMKYKIGSNWYPKVDTTKVIIMPRGLFNLD